LAFYTYILYLFKFVKYKKRDNGNFVNNISYFIVVGPKTNIKSDLVTFFNIGEDYLSLFCTITGIQY